MKHFSRTEICSEAFEPKLSPGELMDQTISSDSQEMNIDDPILSTSCAQSAELSKEHVDDKELSDIQVENSSNKERNINISDNECSIEQERDSVLPESMDISSDSVAQGKTAKCTYKIQKTPCFSTRMFNGPFPALKWNTIVYIHIFHFTLH